MGKDFSFRELSTADKWIFFGNMASALGFLLISVGTTYRLASQGNLPSGRPVSGPAATEPGGQPKDVAQSKARDYFS